MTTGLTDYVYDETKHRKQAALYLLVVVAVTAVLAYLWYWLITGEHKFNVIFFVGLFLVSLFVWFLFGNQAEETSFGVPNASGFPDPLSVLGPIYLIPVLMARIIDGRHLVL